VSQLVHRDPPQAARERSNRSAGTHHPIPLRLLGEYEGHQYVQIHMRAVLDSTYSSVSGLSTPGFSAQDATSDWLESNAELAND
jgi:hypothetical protein